LIDLGRSREGVAKLMQDQDLREKAAARSGAVAGQLMNSYRYAAIQTYEHGQTALAEKYQADWLRNFRAWSKSLPAGSFEASHAALIEIVTKVEFATAAGDAANARELAKGAREGILALKPGDDPARQERAAILVRRLHSALGEAELQSRDFVAAEKQWRMVADARRSTRSVTMSERRWEATELTAWALALARSGHTDEARPLAAKALAVQREVSTMKTEDQWHKPHLAMALVASAYANPKQGAAMIAEAQTVLDSMPAEPRAWKTSRWVDNMIAEARRTVR
jgi:hypothetical protein